MGETMNATQTMSAVEALYATGYWLHSRERHSDAACVFRAMVCVAPKDERGWLGLGLCHEALEQLEVALEIYGTGSAFARAVRCEVARSRVFRAMGDHAGAREALERASEQASLGDEDLAALVANERRADS